MTGRIIATIMGFVFGGPLGALIGFFIGSILDQSVKQGGFDSKFRWKEMFAQPFIRSIFILMGYLAKADGQVTQNEITIASNTMAQLRLSVRQRQQAMRWFYEGKNHQFTLEDIYQKLRIYRNTPLIKIVLSAVTHMAYANGVPSLAQREILKQIYDQLGIVGMGPEQDYQPNYTTQRTSLSADYRLLGLKPDVDVATVRKTYRRLMNKYHPDKLESKGATANDIKAANEKIFTIRQAYENVMRSKGENV